MTPPIDEPTLGEVLRRIDALTAQVADLVREIKDDRAEAARTFMRQDVYVTERRTIEANIADVRADITTVSERADGRFKTIDERFQADADRRRQMWFSIAGLTLTLVLGIAALIVSIVQG